MPPYGYSPLKTERFSGLNSLLDPTNLPSFASPDCQNIEFLPGLVRSRAGLTSLFAALGGNPTVNYLKTYITPLNLLRALVLDSFGNLYKENPFGTLALIGQIENSGVYGNSVSLFGREYIAFGDGQFGAAIPRQFDDTNFDRVSQIGPGHAPGVADENISWSIAASGGANEQVNTTIASPNGLTQNGYTVTVTLTGPTAIYLKVGDPIQITGAGVGGYNGNFTVSYISTDQRTFQYINTVSGLAGSSGTVNFPVAFFLTAGVGGLPQNYGVGQLVNISGVTNAAYNATVAQVRQFSPQGNNTLVVFIGSAIFGVSASGNGTVTNAGSIVAGVHEVSVIFGTRSGYLTAPAASVSWNAAGGKRAVLSSIPTGPPNVTQRIICFTASGGASFFYSTGDPTVFSSAMIINDNSTTSVTIDFSDTILLEGINVDALFNLIELGECSGVTAYNSRLFWWGERNKLNANGGNGFTNLTFDGGFGGSVNNFPLGWDPDPTNFAGGGLGNAAVFGQAYNIIGDGSHAIRGLITQSAVQDSFSNPIISANIAYSVRVRVARDPLGLAFTQGVLHIHLFSTSASIDIGLDITASALTTSFVEYTGVLTAGLASIPSDLLLRVYMDGTPTFGADLNVDNIEIYPTLEPFNSTLIRCSKVEDPESFDGVTGILQPSPQNGQLVRCCYVLRNLLRIVKDSSLFVTMDDGTNEPDQWEVQEVSSKVGTLSARGVGLGDEWAVVVGRSGAWLDDGGAFTEDKKLSREIQPTWDSINWSLGYLVDVKVDTQRKRIYIAVPLGASATKNNTVLMMDYTEGFGDPTPTNLMSIAGLGRKWSIWTIGCNAMNLILRSDNTYQMWFGNNAANGKVYQLDPTRTVFADDGVAFDAHWQSGFFQMPEVARLNWGYLIANVIGAGACNLILRKGDQGWVTNVRPWVLSSFGFHNMERQINVETERLAVFFGTNGIADNFSLQGFSLWAKESAYAPLRGVNAA